MFKQIFNHLFINIYLQTFRYDCGKEVVSQNFVVGNQWNRLERDGSNEYPEQIFEQLFDHIFLESTYIFHDILIHECGKFFSTYACVFGNPTKICVVGNQRNRLSGMVPMGTQNKCLNKCLTIFLESTYIFYRHFIASVGEKLSTKEYVLLVIKGTISMRWFQ